MFRCRVKVVRKGRALREAIRAVGSISLRENRVGEKSGSVVKNRAVAVNTVFLEDSEVVKMPVVVAEQRVHFKEQCEIPGKVRKARIVLPWLLLG